MGKASTFLARKDSNTAFSVDFSLDCCSELNLRQCVASFFMQKHWAWRELYKSLFPANQALPTQFKFYSKK